MIGVVPKNIIEVSQLIEILLTFWFNGKCICDVVFAPIIKKII